MIVPITTLKFKRKLIGIFIILLLTVSAIYLYLHYLQENYDEARSSERCISELTSIKYQLNVVTEYKNRIDKLLTETQKYHDADKERFKDVMESCVAMKQQSSLCQSQFEDLQTECKRVKEDYDKVSKEFEKIKTLR